MSTELSNGVIIPEEYSDDWYDEMSINLRKLNDVITAASDNATDIQRLDTDKANQSDLTALTSRVSQNETDIIALQTAVSGALKREIVQTLPTEDISTTTIYMIRNSQSSGTNIYDEYMYINSQWELIGTSATDFSNYYTKNETDNLLSGKADDNSVVHTSGNETKSGELTLSDTLNSSDIVPIANNSYSSGSSNNQWNNLYAKNYFYNGIAWGLDKSNTWTSSQTYSTGYYGQMVWLKNTDLDLSVNGNTGLSSIYQHMIHWVDKNNAVYSSIQSWTASSETTLVLRSKYRTDANTIRELSVRFTSTATNKVIYPETNADTELGTSTNKWKSFNGLTPSSLSMPNVNASSFVDISGYFTNTGTGEFNTYPVTANGWIFLRLSTISSCQASVLDSNSNLLYGTTTSGDVEQILVPVIAGTTFQTQWATGSTVTVANARFIPCQGNI